MIGFGYFNHGCWSCCVKISPQDLPTQASDCVLLRAGDAVHWVRRCVGGKEPPSGALMRFLGVLEMPSRWNFGAMHVPGLLNDVADEFSRWEKSAIHANLVRARPHIRCRIGSWQKTTKILISPCWSRIREKHRCALD